MNGESREGFADWVGPRLGTLDYEQRQKSGADDQSWTGDLPITNRSSFAYVVVDQGWL